MNKLKKVGIIAGIAAAVAGIGYVVYKCTNCLMNFDDLDFEEDNDEEDFYDDEDDLY